MKTHNIRLVGYVALLIFAGASHAGVMVPIPGDPVTIDSGKVAGTLLDSGVRAYYGLPFAAPPVRELRWHEPMPVKPWRGVYNADSMMPQCMQPLRAFTRDRYYENNATAEDCLYLNLWAPATARRGARLPVVVWIYGGAFSEGSASYVMYGGQELVKKGVIYVAISYRVGIFGYLAHPGLTRESGRNASGNWGMLDQVAALKWVQRNIGAFGGDAANVTLMGQSAGAMSINDLNVSPMAHGLFAKLIGLSGSFVTPGGQSHDTLKEAETIGVRLQEAMKASSLEDMRTAAPDTILTIAQQARHSCAACYRRVFYFGSSGEYFYKRKTERCADAALFDSKGSRR
jgi:para-nitrobenzyl esterase